MPTNAPNIPAISGAAWSTFAISINLILIAFVVGIGIGLVFWARKWGHERKDFPKSLWGVSSILVGIIVMVLFALPSQHDFAIDLIAGLCSTIVCLQIGEILGRSSLSDKLKPLERALDSTTTYERINSILNNLENIKQIRSQCFEAASFIDETLSNCFATLDSKLAPVARGEVSIDNVRELTANKEFLLKLPSKHVFAVSYQDENFWGQPEGIAFLKAHETAIENGCKIHRIFVLKKMVAPSQETAIRHQIELGVDCRIAIEEDIPIEYHEDFVLYDNKYARFARQISAQFKVATLTGEADHVKRYAEKWGYLENRSQTAEEFYDANKTKT
jgi:hypothetical protein